jgi:ribosomal protein L37E
VPKEQWKECRYCGATTDIDEKYCPNRGFGNPKHKLRIVRLEKREVKERCEKGKIWTKNVSSLERRLSQ